MKNKSILFLFFSLFLYNNVYCQQNDTLAQYISVIKSNIYKDFKGMFRDPAGALVYPFLTPGSVQYSNVLWDWDSWLSNVALRQIFPGYWFSIKTVKKH